MSPRVTMADRVIVWGAAGHSKVVADILRTTGSEVAGFVDEVNQERRGTLFCGAKILVGMEEAKQLHVAGVRRAVVGFGNNKRRLAVAELLGSLNFELVKAIHPSAVLAADVVIGAGSVVAAGSVLNPSISVGRNVIINTRASVDHDCVIEDGAHVGPGANIAGHVHIGRGVWIGIGATVIDHRSIGAGSIVGAGAVVIRDVPERTVVAGVPAHVIRRAD